MRMSFGRIAAAALAVFVALGAGMIAVAPWEPPAAGGTVDAGAIPQPTAPDVEAPVEPPPPAADPVIKPIPDAQWERIVATGTWRPGCPVGREDLRRLEVGYIGFDGQYRRGVLVAHRDSVQDLAEIFTGLFDAGFPIGLMVPVEKYGGDVVRSLRANNTSAFNCRKPGQINAPVKESPHANGRAVDINPVQNPWMDPRCDCWVPSAKHAKQTDGPGIIREESLPVFLFESRGWVWQNIKVPDYMHFDTGFPSKARTQAPAASG